MSPPAVVPRVLRRPLFWVGAAVALAVLGFAALSLLADRTTSRSAGTIQAAEKAYSEGRFSEAEAVLADLVASDRGNAKARRLLALTLAAQGKNEEAITVYEEVVKADPKDHESYYRMAVLERLVGRTTDAISHFESAVNLKKDALYADELARTYMQVGRYADAIELWKSIVSSGGMKEAEAAQVYSAMASAYEGLRDYESAVTMLEKALALTPNDESLKSRLAALKGGT